MLRLSRSHDQNRRRAGETAGKAAMPAVQRDVLKQKKRSGGPWWGWECRGVGRGVTADGHRKHGGASRAKKSCVGRKASLLQPV